MSWAQTRLDAVRFEDVHLDVRLAAMVEDRRVTGVIQDPFTVATGKGMVGGGGVVVGVRVGVGVTR